MPRAKISEFSTIPGDNTDIDGINIAEGCAPSGINDAIRELMAQLKDFQSGAAGDNITVVGTLAAKGTSSSGADLKLYEDTDNGTNYVGFIAPASIASNVQWTLPSADGSSGQALQTNGSGTLSFATLGISAGGTGQTTANAAFNALAPSQTSNAGRYLKTDGTNTSWDLLDISTADITGTLPVANGGTGQSSYTTGDLLYATGSTALSKLGIGTNGQVLTSTGTAPQWSTLSGVAVTTFSAGTTGFTPSTATSGAITLGGTLATTNGGTGLTSFTANGVVYASSTSALATGSALTFNGTTLSLPSGNIAIGSSTSGRTLEVFNGDAVNLQRLRLTTSGTDGVIQVTRASGTVPNLIFQQDASELMRLTSTGLGIGTSSPATKLQVNAAAPVIRIQETSSGGDKRLELGVTSVGQAYIGANQSAQTLQFQTVGSTQMTLDANGNLGLGVTSLSASLQVSRTTPSFWLFETGSGTGHRIEMSVSGTGVFNQNLNWNSGLSSRAFTWSQAGTENMRLDASGNLGLGVTPSAWSGTYSGALQVKSAAVYSASDFRADIASNSFFDGSAFKYINTGFATALSQVSGQFRWFTAPSGTAGNTISFTQAMTLDASGNLLVGKTSVDDSLAGIALYGTTTGPYISATRNGLSGAFRRLATDGDVIGFRRDATSVGSISVTTTATAYNTSSDYRLKNITGPITNSGAYIDSLKPVEGTWKNDNSVFVGLIAHEVQEVSRTKVATGVKDGEEMQAMDYSSAELIANLIAEIQSLRARVAQLEAK